MSTFYWNKYHDDDLEREYVDGADTYGNAGFSIGFHHLISGKEVYFKAFITSFNETFSPDWSSESVYGRVDPIYTFRQTTRNISLNFKIPAASLGEGYENLAKTQLLTQFLYPAYSDVTSATTIAQSSLVRIKVMNLLQNSNVTSNSSQSPEDLYTNYFSAGGASSGLLSVINSLTINHNLESDDVGVFEKGQGENGGATILPKMIDISMGFAVIHETPLGWYDSENTSNDPFQSYLGQTSNIAFGNEAFPYGAQLSTSEASQPASGGSGGGQAGRDSDEAAGTAAIS